MIYKRVLVPLGAPVNSFQIKIPHNTATTVAAVSHALQVERFGLDAI